MKRLLLPVLAAALALAALPVTIRAQSAVPGLITFQGKVSDAAGTLIGTGTPVNRKVRFRIYTSPTSVLAADRLHTEEQTVTIANGEFNVLLGSGVLVTGETLAASLDTVFTGAARYLGVTVDGGSGTFSGDPEISPRQQIVTMPYAFRAKIAEGVVSQSVTAAMLANNTITATQLAPATITGTQLANLTVATANLADNAITTTKILDSTIATADLADNSITTAKILDGTIATADLANGAVTSAKLAADIGVWSVSGANLFRNSNVGIGTSTLPAGDRLTVSGGNLRLDNFRYLAFSAGVDNFTHNGVTMSNYGVGSFVDSDLGISASLWLSGWQGLKFFTGGSPRMVIRGDGNVGIGTSGGTALAKLDIGGNTHGATQVILTRGSDDNFRLVAQNRSVNNNPGSEVSRFGITYGATEVKSGFAFNRGGGGDDTDVLFLTSGLVRARVHGDGRIGMAGSNDNSQVQVLINNTSGRVYPFAINSSTGSGFFFEHNGNVYKPGGGGWGAWSDARLKTDIRDLSGSLDQLLRLHSVNFRFKDEARYGTGLQTGFIAQEVEKVFPSWVSDGPDGFKAITVRGFESHAVQALRELRAEKDAQIAQRDATIAVLEQRVKDLETQTMARLAALENRLNATSVTANSPR
jgi:hypothetical protein